MIMYKEKAPVIFNKITRISPGMPLAIFWLQDYSLFCIYSCIYMHQISYIRNIWCLSVFSFSGTMLVLANLSKKLYFGWGLLTSCTDTDHQTGSTSFLYLVSSQFSPLLASLVSIVTFDVTYSFNSHHTPGVPRSGFIIIIIIIKMEKLHKKHSWTFRTILQTLC